jgi:hypothetical protein
MGNIGSHVDITSGWRGPQVEKHMSDLSIQLVASDATRGKRKWIGNWSLTSLHQRLVKTGGRLVKHARYYWLLLVESHLIRRLFGSVVRRIEALAVATGQTEAMGGAKLGDQGGEGRRGVCGMRRENRISRFWISPAVRQLRLARAKTVPRRKNATRRINGWRLDVC